jgi:uncharacterized protein (DUF486 family)
MDALGPIDLNDVLYNRPLFTVSAALMGVLFLLNFVIKNCPEVLGLVAANTLITNTFVWNLVSSCFYETNIFKFVWNCAALFLLTKSLPIPSFEQFGLYFVFSILACTIGMSTYAFVTFFTMQSEIALVTPVYGFSGVLMTILMFARHEYQSMSVHPAFPKVTYQHLPVVLLVVQIVLYFAWCGFLVTDLPFSVIALLFSWSYLRFYYKHTINSEELGDKSDSFSFVAMFPEVVLVLILHLIL